MDEQSSDVARIFTQIKMSLKPLLFEASKEAHEKGIPVLRSMVLEFPDDPACETLDRQYMLGDKLLVAPVFTEDGSVTYYIPAGKWKHYIDGREIKLEDGRWFTETYSFESLPLWEKM